MGFEMMPRNYGLMAIHAQKRYFKNGKKTEEDRFNDLGVKASERFVNAMVAILRCGSRYTEDDIRAIDQNVSRMAKQYVESRNVYEQAKTEHSFKSMTDAHMPTGLCIPATRDMKTLRDWAELSTERRAVENTMRFYAKALYDRLDMKKDEIKTVFALALDLYGERARKERMKG